MQIKIIEVSYHRNGICGEPFHVVLFKWKDEDAHRKPWRNMLAHVFDDAHYCAVHCLDMPTVKFGVNSWRGDHFDPEMRQAIKDNESSGSVRVGPFAIPTE